MLLFIFEFQFRMGEIEMIQRIEIMFKCSQNKKQKR